MTTWHIIMWQHDIFVGLNFCFTAGNYFEAGNDWQKSRIPHQADHIICKRATCPRESITNLQV